MEGLLGLSGLADAGDLTGGDLTMASLSFPDPSSARSLSSSPAPPSVDRSSPGCSSAMACFFF